MGFKLPKLDKTMKIVDPDGTPSPRFQIFWQFNTIRLDDASAAAVSALPTIAAASYDQAQFQAVLDFCNALQTGLDG